MQVLILTEDMHMNARVNATVLYVVSGPPPSFPSYLGGNVAALCLIWSSNRTVNRKNNLIIVKVTK